MSWEPVHMDGFKWVVFKWVCMTFRTLISPSISTDMEGSVVQRHIYIQIINKMHTLGLRITSRTLKQQSKHRVIHIHPDRWCVRVLEPSYT